MRTRFTVKEKAFIKYYVIYGIGTTAAKKAGYSLKTAYSTAHKLLKKPKIIKAIEDAEKKRLEDLSIDTQEILHQYYNLATADINDYFVVKYKLYHPYDYQIYKRRNKKNYNDRTYDLLKKYIGYKITKDEFDILAPKHKLYFEQYNELKDFSDLTKQQRAAIQKITYDKYGNPILHLSNKETSLDALAKVHGMYEKDNMQKSVKEVIEKRSLNDFYS